MSEGKAPDPAVQQLILELRRSQDARTIETASGEKFIFFDNYDSDVEYRITDEKIDHMIKSLREYYDQHPDELPSSSISCEDDEEEIDPISKD